MCIYLVVAFIFPFVFKGSIFYMLGLRITQIVMPAVFFLELCFLHLFYINLHDHCLISRKSFALLDLLYMNLYMDIRKGGHF